jgi:hypothetical protein
MAKISHIFRTPKKRLPMEEVEEARVIKNFGLEGLRTRAAGWRPETSVAG